jgi:hypothetical protein
MQFIVHSNIACERLFVWTIIAAAACARATGHRACLHKSPLNYASPTIFLLSTPLPLAWAFHSLLLHFLKTDFLSFLSFDFSTKHAVVAQDVHSTGRSCVSTLLAGRIFVIPFD